MKANCIRSIHLPLVLTVLYCVLLVGCNSQSHSRSEISCTHPNLEGKWSWQQGSYHGYFILTKKGESYEGTLDDEYEGTYGDKIVDIEVEDDNIKFTRYGKYGVQYWQGTLDQTDGQLKIIDGQWGKGSSMLGSFEAEKVGS